MEQILLKKIAKVFLAAVIFSFIAVFGYIAGGVVKYNLDVRKADKSVERFQDSLEQPYKEDTYGGKTPEETWAMYLDALRKGDINLAIKYYEVGRVEGVPVDALYTKKQNGQLEEWIKELETLEKDEQQLLSGEKSYYFYNYYNEKFRQTLSSPVIFYLNPYTKVWKIVSL